MLAYNETMNELQDKICTEIMTDSANRELTEKGYRPLFTCSPSAKIVIVGQAPGLKAQERQLVWEDASGDKLVSWLGISKEQLRDPAKIAILPMDFYYPGKGKSGDLPPRKDFAPKWHKRILAEMPAVQLTILVGKYTQEYYLADRVGRNLTETVRHWHKYLPEFFPIVHPSPLNFRWQAKNPWFEAEVVPELRRRVKQILG